MSENKKVSAPATEQQQKNKMGHAPMMKLIVSMSLPAIFSMLIQALYNIVDSMYVAQIGEKALTAVSLAFPVQQLLIAVGVGTGVGLNSLISRRLGEKRFDEADKAASHGMFLGLASGIVFAILGALFIKPFFGAFTGDAEVIKMGCDYGYVVTILSFGSFVQISCEKILQATGNMIWPMMFQLTGAITNIILDPIFIFGWFGMPKMGVLGAAIATVAGQILGMLLGIFVLFKKEHEVKVHFKGFRPDGKILKDIYRVGFPSIIMQSIGSFMTMGLNAILIGFSQAAVAVMGVYNKLQSFVFMPVFGLTQGLMPIMGYNFGAKNKKRLISAIKIGECIAVGIMVLGTLLFNLFPRQLLQMFNASADMMSTGIPAMHILSACFITAAVSIVFSTSFQATGHGTASLFTSILRQLVVILPVAFLLSRTGLGATGVWLAFPIAELVCIVFSVGLFRRIYDQEIRYLGDVD